MKVDPTGPLPPTSILPYVQRIAVYAPSSNRQWEFGEEIIRRMSRLTHIYWEGGGGRRQSKLRHLRLLLTSPTVQSLTLSNAWLQPDTSGFTGISSGLRILRIDFRHPAEGSSPTRPGFLEEHLSCMDSVYEVLRPRLESLTLSAYSAKLSSLAAASWPSLRTFTITRGDAVLDTSWERLLFQMPALSALTVALACDETPTILIRDGAEASLSGLRHLTISFPHPDDKVFSSAPPELRELSLRDSPRFYTFRWIDGSDPPFEPILTCSDVLRIFSVLSATSLTALELVYLESFEEFQMLGALSRSCPNLTLLEFHRYPLKRSRKDAWYKGELTIPVDAIAESLAEFKSLRVLKLNLCFTDYDLRREAGSFPPDYWDRLADFIAAHAYTIALRIPWIKTVSILTRTGTACAMHWDTWSVHAEGAFGGPKLMRDGIYHDSGNCHESAYV
ncbi:hypothetical protein AURDEDRAFT_171096 [Auricularia subglabra TFB-10046 SS5]|nr:hypothetical protein AURDEDRAFT_171096 [Auricularia subglabra TFB-10046 SS5]